MGWITMINHKNYTELKYKKHGENRIFLYKDGTLLNQFSNIKDCYEFLLNYDKDFNVSYNALYKAIISNKKYEYKGYSFNWFNSYRVFTGVEIPIYKPNKNEILEIKKELKGKIDVNLIDELIDYLYNRGVGNE